VQLPEKCRKNAVFNLRMWKSRPNSPISSDAAIRITAHRESGIDQGAAEKTESDCNPWE
jgi:hypothetical protein